MLLVFLFSIAFAQDCTNLSCVDCVDSNDCQWDSSTSTCSQGTSLQDTIMCEFSTVTFQTDTTLCQGLDQTTCQAAYNCVWENLHCSGKPVSIQILGPVNVAIEQSGSSSSDVEGESSVSDTSSLTDTSADNGEVSIVEPEPSSTYTESSSSYTVTSETSTETSTNSGGDSSSESSSSASESESSVEATTNSNEDSSSESSGSASGSETSAEAPINSSADSASEQNGSSENTYQITDSSLSGSESIETGSNPSSAADASFTGSNQPSEIVCTSDVLQCPDGSFASRNAEIGCKFEDCPVVYVYHAKGVQAADLIRYSHSLREAFVRTVGGSAGMETSRIELTPLPDGTNIRFITTESSAEDTVNSSDFGDRLALNLRDVDGLNSMLGLVEHYARQGYSNAGNAVNTASGAAMRVLINDCEMLLTRATCFGMHEGNQCMWDAYDRKCIESSYGDPDHICRQYRLLSECNNNPRCTFDFTEGKCVQGSDGSGMPIFGSGSGGPGPAMGPGPNRGMPNGGAIDPNTRPNMPPRGPVFPPPAIADCEEYITPTACKGKFHDGKSCMWSMEKMSCIESTPGDLEHICGQYGTPQSCRHKLGCVWGTEMKCEQGSEYGLPTGIMSLLPQILPYLKGDSNSNNNGNTQSGTGSSNESVNTDSSSPSQVNPRPIPRPPRPHFPMITPNGDCEIYVTREMCMGKFHEGSQCFWRAEDRQCVGGEVGDMEHICGQFMGPMECRSRAGCLYDAPERVCREAADVMETPFFPSPGFRPPNPTINGGSYTPGTGPIYSEGNRETSNSGISSDSASSNTNTNFNSGFSPHRPSPGLLNADCETFLTSQTCRGKFHEQSQCYWSVEARECIEGEIGDMQHICGEYAIPSSCSKKRGCGWEAKEHRCKDCVDIEAGCFFPSSVSPGFTRATNQLQRVKPEEINNLKSQSNTLLLSTITLGAAGLITGVFIGLYVHRMLEEKPSSESDQYLNLDDVER